MSIANLLTSQNPNDQSYLNITVNNIDVEGMATISGNPVPSSLQTSYTDTMSGPWAAPLNINVNLSKIGNIVYMTVTGDTVETASVATYITFNTPLPAAYWPADQIYCPCVIADNSLIAPGFAEVEANDGAVYIETYHDGGNFYGTGATGVTASATFTWPAILALP
jgi:hypothetical protein